MSTQHFSPIETSEMEFQSETPRSLWGDAVREFRRSRTGMLGLFIVVVILFVALTAQWIAPYDYAEQDWMALRQPPTMEHPMGTDAVGRDLFSRVLVSVQTAMLVGVVVSVIVGVVGTLAGAIAALIGGIVDTIIVWVMDALLNFPTLWLAAFVTVVARPPINQFTQSAYDATGWEIWQNSIVLDYLVVFTCLAFVSWAPLGRLVRGQVLSLREKEFVEAQVAIGASRWWITTRHLVPNVMGPVIVQLSVGIGGVMLAESALSFLGIGIQPPGASLGTLISIGMESWRSDPHMVAMPGLVLAIIILSFVFVGDALNDALNPRIRER
jgi:oligopeptide transport system permease protein